MRTDIVNTETKEVLGTVDSARVLYCIVQTKEGERAILGGIDDRKTYEVAANPDFYRLIANK
jgi:hypothetical protein